MMSDTDFASYADDNTPYVSADTIDEVIKRLETASVKLFKWFADNQMKANQDKCHLIVSKNENISMHTGPFEIKSTNCEKLLGIKVDSRLNFNEYLDGIIVVLLTTRLTVYTKEPYVLYIMTLNHPLKIS